MLDKAVARTVEQLSFGPPRRSEVMRGQTAGPARFGVSSSSAWRCALWRLIRA